MGTNYYPDRKRQILMAQDVFNERIIVEINMKVASIQMVVKDNKSSNIVHAENLIDKVQGSDLILLPELWSCSYFSFEKYEKESEPLDGPTISRIGRKAREIHAYILAGSIVEKRDDGLYNTSILLNRDGEISAVYRKIHLFSFDSLEKTLIKPGRETVAVKTEFGVFGLAICYDIRFPELFRKLSSDGAEVFLIPAAWPSGNRLEHWITLNQARALENLAYLISCDCIGKADGGRAYQGRSMIVDPWGIIVASAGYDEEILKVTINIERVHEIRSQFPVLKDRVIY